MLYYNQKLLKQANFSEQNRAFLFGDAVFETCLIKNYQIINFTAHLNRLQQASAFLAMPCQIATIIKQSNELIKINQQQNGILRIQIGRNQGSNGYLPSADCDFFTIIQTLSNRPSPTDISLIVSNRNITGNFRFKTSNSLPYVLAKIDAQQQQATDSIIVDNGIVCETGSANIFWRIGDKLYTPSDNCKLIFGTVRKIICNKFAVDMVEWHIDQLKTADEVFITNSIILAKSVNNIRFSDGSIVNYQHKIIKDILKFLG